MNTVRIEDAEPSVGALSLAPAANEKGENNIAKDVQTPVKTVFTEPFSFSIVDFVE